jgi:hypothetical protein
VNILLASLFAGSAQAATLAAEPGGDLQGYFDTLSAGDEVVLSDGVYRVNATLVLSEKRGREDSPIVVRAEEGATPILQLVTDLDGAYPGRFLQISSSTFVRVEGITFQGDVSAGDDSQTYAGIQIDSSSDITIFESVIKDVAGTAIYLSGDTNGVTIDHSEISRVYNGYAVYAGCSDVSCLTTDLTLNDNLIHDLFSEDAEAVRLNHGSAGAVLTDNVVFNITYRGFWLGSTEGGVANTLEGNAVWNLGDRGVVLQGAALVRNNIIFNTGGSGIVTRDPERGFFEDIIISYNTIVDNDEWAADLEGWDEGLGLVLANNALCNPMSYGVYLAKIVPEGAEASDIETPGTVVGNYVCGLVDGPDEDLREVIAGGGYADFSNVEIWDFYPVTDSLLVDAADPSGELYPPEVDFNGQPREGDKPDVGAYEWDGDGNPGWAIQEDFKDFEIVEETVDAAVESGCCSDSDKSSEAGLLLLPFVGLGVGLRRRRRQQTRQ